MDIPPSVDERLDHAAPTTPSGGMSVFIPLLAPSMNSLLQIVWAQRKLEARPEIRLFRSQFKRYLPVWSVQPDTLYAVDFMFIEDWYYANGKLKRKDAPNLIKCCLDALMERYAPLDDSCIWRLTCSKIDRTERQGIALSITPCGDAKQPEMS